MTRRSIARFNDIAAPAVGKIRWDFSNITEIGESYGVQDGFLGTT
jgi:hypothetical protein